MADELLIKYKTDLSEFEAKLTVLENRLRGVEATAKESAQGVGDAFAKESVKVDTAGNKLNQRFTGLNGGIKDTKAQVYLLSGAMGVLGSKSDGLTTLIFKLHSVINLAKGANLLLANSFKSVAVAEGEAAVATRGFTAAIAANPIGAAITAIIALTAAFFALSDSEDDAAENAQKLKDIQDALSSEDLRLKLEALNAVYEKKNDQSEADIKLAKIQGETRQQLHDKEIKLVDDEIAQLQRKRDEVEKSRGLTVEESDAFELQLQKLSNSRKQLNAQFTADQEADEKKRLEDRRAFLEKLNKLEISAIANDNDRKHAQLLTDFNKDLNDLGDALDKKLIKYSEFNDGVIALQKKLATDLGGLQTIEKAPIINPNQSNIGGIKNIFSGSFTLTPEEEEAIKQKLRDQAAEIIDSISQLGDALFTFSGADFNDELQGIQDRNDLIVDGLDKEAAALEKKNERGAISDRQYQIEKEKLDKKRADNLAKFNAEEKKIKNQQAQADWQKSIFDVITGTAVAIIKAAPNVPLEILTAALGALQLANVVGHPPPKFAKGTKSVERGKYRLGIDTIPAWLTEGERVVPVHQNKKNWEIYEAIDNNKLEDLIHRKYVVPVIVEYQKRQVEKEQLRNSQAIGRGMITGMSGLSDSQMRKLFNNGLPITNPDAIGEAIAKHLPSNNNYGSWKN